MRGTVMLIDDEAMIRQSTEQWLKMAGFEVLSFDNAEAGLAALDDQFPGIIVSDVKMPGMDGLTLMAEAQQRISELPVILITGHGDVDMAIKAMREGAYDFVEKPFVPERLVENIHRACEKRRLMLENLRLQHDLSTQTGLDAKIIGTSPAIQRMKRELLKCAELDTNVIIYGETGTGKELVAQCLHEFSTRQGNNFVPLNCGAIPEALIESELFGHEAGAFTSADKQRVGKFEYANGGTLFLDEIEIMPVNLQVKLLRALQEGMIERLGSNKPIPVDLRVVAASKVDLKSDDSFRQDLYYRLNVTQLQIPPLREREEDIVLLFEHYARQTAAQHERDLRRATAQDIQNLEQYKWPGNVRELRNVAIRYALDGSLPVADILFPPEPMLANEAEESTLSLAAQVANFESKVISASLSRHQGNIKSVLEELDLPRRTLNQKMAKYGLNRADFLCGEE